MSEFFFEITLFSSKIIFLLILLGVFFSIIGSAAAEYKKQRKKEKLEIEDFGEKLQQYQLTMHSYTRSAKNLKKEIKSLKKQKKQTEKTTLSGVVYILDFKGDVQASQVKRLREEISILIKSANPKTDEVVLRLNNHGGLVPNHGLGASQLQRLRSHELLLTVCVDEVAGSGGYLMACTANKILAAPFAVIGSIGVLAQMPNFYRFLQKQNVDFEEISAGKHKRTLTLFGKATEEKREKLRSQLEDIHESFKNYIAKHRPNVDLSKTATGDFWLGEKAKELGLVDQISTSDDYLLSLLNQNKKVYHVSLKGEESKLPFWLNKKVAQHKELIHSVSEWIKNLLTKI